MVTDEPRGLLPEQRASGDRRLGQRRSCPTAGTGSSAAAAQARRPETRPGDTRSGPPLAGQRPREQDDKGRHPGAEQRTPRRRQPDENTRGTEAGDDPAIPLGDHGMEEQAHAMAAQTPTALAFPMVVWMR